MYLYAKVTGIGTHPFDEVFIILRLYEDGTPFHTSVEDMIVTGNFDTGFSGHRLFPDAMWVDG